MIYYLHGVTVGVSPDVIRYFGGGNLANYDNSEAIDILRDLYNISDEKTLKEKFTALQNMYESDRPYIGLYFNSITSIYGKSLVATVSNNWFNIFSNIDDWYRKN